MKQEYPIQSLSEFKTLKKTETRLTVKDYDSGKGLKTVDSSVVSISPMRNNNSAAISKATRNKILSYAHPVDAAIIKTLDTPAINAVFNKIVQASIDATWGLSLSTGIHVSSNIYPELYQIVEECSQCLGIPTPYVIISDQVKGINACTAGTNQFSFIAISSMLPLVLNREELKFVIGHECGHLALGHVVYHTAISVAGTAGGLIPMVGEFISKTISYPLNAWSRRSEISADRAGLLCCGDINVAVRSLFKLEAGLLKVDNIDIDEYLRESEAMLSSSTLGKFSEFNMSHPIIPKRIKALKLFRDSAVYAEASGDASVSGNSLLSREMLAKETEKIIEIM